MALFVSYAHKNRQFVDAFCEVVKNKLDLTIWKDTDCLHSGDDFLAQIYNGMIEAKVVLCFISAAYLESKTCRRELKLADDKDKQIMLIMIESVDIESDAELTMRIIGKQRSLMYKNISNGDMWSGILFEKLLVDIGFLLKIDLLGIYKRQSASEQNARRIDLSTNQGYIEDSSKKEAETVVSDNLSHMDSAIESDTKPECKDILEACEKGNIDDVKYWIDFDPKLVNDSKNIQYVQTPLQCASRCGHAEIVEFLLQNKARINKHGSNGLTPLIEAVKNGQVHIVNMLIQNGANIETTDNEDDATPIIHACVLGNEEILKLLIQAKASVNRKDKYKNFALSYAAGKGYLTIVDLLLKADVCVNAKSQFNQTALMFASINGHKEVIELLIKNGAKVNVKTKNGDTAFTFALNNGHTECAQLLKQTIDKD